MSLSACVSGSACRSVCLPVFLPPLPPPAPLSRYLLNLDGHTAAYRLGHLLATNSLVLKQESPMVEYYYRCVVPDFALLFCFPVNPNALQVCFERGGGARASPMVQYYYR